MFKSDNYCLWPIKDKFVRTLCFAKVLKFTTIFSDWSSLYQEVMSQLLVWDERRHLRSAAGDHGSKMKLFKRRLSFSADKQKRVSNTNDPFEHEVLAHTYTSEQYRPCYTTQYCTDTFYFDKQRVHCNALSFIQKRCSFIFHSILFLTTICTYVT